MRDAADELRRRCQARDLFGWMMPERNVWQVYRDAAEWSSRGADGLAAGLTFTDTELRAWLGLGSPTRRRLSTRSAAVAARDEAMARVDSDPDDSAFRAWVHQWVAALPPGAEFIGDDVWQAIEACVEPPTCHDPRVLGPTIKRAATLGLIEPTGTYRPSHRRHMSTTAFLGQWDDATTDAICRLLVSVRAAERRRHIEQRDTGAVR